MAYGGSTTDSAAILKDMETGRDQAPNPYTENTPRPDGSGYPPAYYNPGQCNVQMTTMQPMQAGQLMVAQPMEAGAPETTCALVTSLLSAMFCFMHCGMAAMFVAWQARLQVLDRKFAHARHSLTVVWMFLGLSFFFGLVFWGLMIWYFTLVTSATRYYG